MDYLEYVQQLKNNRMIFEKLFIISTAELSRWKPDPDRWSLLEIVCHLSDIEVEDFRYDFDLILYHPEDPWPHFDEMEWVTSRKYNQQNFGKISGRFLKERDKSIEWLLSLENPDLGSVHSGKEISGRRLGAGDILSSWVAHDLFHIRQIVLVQYDLLNAQTKPFSTSYSGFYS